MPSDPHSVVSSAHVLPLLHGSLLFMPSDMIHANIHLCSIAALADLRPLSSTSHADNIANMQCALCQAKEDGMLSQVTRITQLCTDSLVSLGTLSIPKHGLYFDSGSTMR